MLTSDSMYGWIVAEQGDMQTSYWKFLNFFLSDDTLSTLPPIVKCSLYICKYTYRLISYISLPITDQQKLGADDIIKFYKLLCYSIVNTFVWMILAMSENLFSVSFTE
jgi:hypothetical protein